MAMVPSIGMALVGKLLKSFAWSLAESDWIFLNLKQFLQDYIITPVEHGRTSKKIKKINPLESISKKKIKILSNVRLYDLLGPGGYPRIALSLPIYGLTANNCR